jgi:hypothetical protein
MIDLLKVAQHLVWVGVDKPPRYRPDCPRWKLAMVRRYRMVCRISDALLAMHHHRPQTFDPHDLTRLRREANMLKCEEHGARWN